MPNIACFRPTMMMNHFKAMVNIAMTHSLITVCIINATYAQVNPSGSVQQQVDLLAQRAKQSKLAGNYDQSYAYLDSALVLAKNAGHERLSAFVMSELGVVCMYQGRSSDALKLMFKGLRIQEELHDSVQMANSYNYIAALHHGQSDHTTAIKYYVKSQNITEKLNNPRSLGILYNNLGSLYEDKGEYTKGLEYHEKSMQIWEELSDSSWIAVSFRHLGFCLEQQGKLDEALASYLLAHDMSLKLGTRMNVSRSRILIGNLYLALGRAHDAKTWCNSAYELALEESNIYRINESCFCLYRAHEALGKPQKALDYYKIFIQARDSAFGNDRIKELTSQELKFVFEKEQLADSLQFVKQQMVQEKQIQTQRAGLISAGMALFMILILAFVVYRGKKRSDHLLLNILPAEIAEELKESGYAKAQHLPMVTVLFTDFKGFTELSEKMTPEELVDEMHACFSVLDDIMTEFGVEKIKTIGDAYMAAGGVPTQTPTHALDVVKAAISSQQFMTKRAEERKSKGLNFFEMRLGIHSGPVVAGIVGTKKFQYDIWGDTVNTAARMEQHSEPGKINISKETYELVKDEIICDYRGKILAKGKGEIDMYYVSS